MEVGGFDFHDTGIRESRDTYWVAPSTAAGAAASKITTLRRSPITPEQKQWILNLLDRIDAMPFDVEKYMEQIQKRDNLPLINIRKKISMSQIGKTSDVED